MNRSIIKSISSLLFLVSFQILICDSEVIRPRGVSLARKIFYDPSKDFTCIDGSKTIKFTHVNDDYCDCADGSDEPGTAACPMGSFHCSNIGYFEKDIYSSMVNDGICDCCDGSDEWASGANCVNNCMELGELSRQEYLRQQEILRQGNEIRQGYVKDATEKKLNINAQIDQLKQELVGLEKEKNDKNAVKEESDQLEREALDQHNIKLEELKKAFEENEAKKAKEEEERLAKAAFKELDVNEDGNLHFTEIIKFGKFDQNADGIVSEEEAKMFLNNRDSMALDEFLSIGWTLVRPFYLMQKPETTATNEQHETEPQNHENTEHDSESQVSESNPNIETEDDLHEDLDALDDTEHNQEDYQSDSYDHETAKEDYESKSSDHQQVQAPELEYDEETKQLIERAKANRDSYTNAEQQFLTVQNKIRDLENSIQYDYGLEDEFLPLHGQCFELTDREYTYKLCPFDSATQRPKDGGGETNLGRWGQWTGGEGRKYSSFKLENGSVCWNGPPRSLDVILRCGLENRVVSASEPARCEYLFEFETPALCVLETAHSSADHAHTEL